MIISLDYDDTFTRDPLGWIEAISLLRSRGHTVYCVTMRYEEHEGDVVKKNLQNHVDGIFFTGRQLKQKFMFDKGICISVWIDDCAGCIV
jgi:hypothetical protein